MPLPLIDLLEAYEGWHLYAAYTCCPALVTMGVLAVLLGYSERYKKSGQQSLRLGYTLVLLGLLFLIFGAYVIAAMLIILILCVSFVLMDGLRYI